MKTRFLVARGMSVAGRKLYGGEPMPPGGVTHTIRELGWIRPADDQEWERACAEYGTPPDGELLAGWDFKGGTLGAPSHYPAGSAGTQDDGGQDGGQDDDDGVTLDDMTKAELTAYADSIDLELPASMKKADMIDAIIEHEAAAAPVDG